MSVVTLCAQLRALRQRPLWTLLGADKAPAAVALISSSLLGNEKTLPSSALRERLAHHIAQLRAVGEELDRPAQAYIADWLSRGWLTRHFPEGAAEEVYEISAEAASAARFLQGLLRPRSSATESRLHTVIQQLARLAEDTDDDPSSRLQALLAERARIDEEIAAAQRGVIDVLPEDRALERAREIISLADELAGDFRRVRDAFSSLARELRQSLVEGDDSRAEILEKLFCGIDLIGESDAGRSFAAFWRLLTDPAQSQLLHVALREVIKRPFSKELTRDERRFLTRLTAVLSAEGGAVQSVQQSFARSLKSFVQSREFLEHRRVNGLLNDALRAALSAKDHCRPSRRIGYELALSRADVRSVSQIALEDPHARDAMPDMEAADSAAIELATIMQMLRHSEIDFRALKANVAAALAERSQISVARLLELYPIEQGLGSVVGYLA
ncbi:MAG: hypothetical protein JWM26_3436, partial [Betaproteobacteria bacterium]|nr:hypothetical protein [Betaproteobacteria bacterium]